MADISRNTTPAWQDPHLKDRVYFVKSVFRV